MILLIPIAFGLLMVNCYVVSFQNSPQALRRSFLTALIGLLLFFAVSTEFLSIFNQINLTGISISWCLLTVILIFWHLRLRRKDTIDYLQIFKNWTDNSTAFLSHLGILTTVTLLSLLLITFAVGIISTPNNIDSLAYHLSRIGYWIQNQNIEHYASHIERAISFSPFSEYVHLHTLILAGSERFFQSLQWFCLIGILGFVSLLIEILGGSKSALRLSLVFSATLPIVLLESMTTQNDLVVTLFIIATAFYIFDYLKSNNRLNILLLSVVIGLGFLTKGTFFFYTLPFGAYLLGQLIRSKQFIIVGALLLGISVSTIALNLPFWYRTYEIFDSPVGNVTTGNQNEIFSAKQFLSSTSKHVFLHLGFVSPQNRYNDFLETQLISFHDILDVPLNSPSSGMSFKMNKLNFNEDFAHNFIGIWLIFIGLFLFPFARLGFAAKRYVWLTLTSFLLFCFFISYQIYGSRLHIPFFILMAPAIGLIFGSFRSLVLEKILISILWISGLPYTILSVTHPLLSTKWFFKEVFPVLNKPLKLNIHPDKMLNFMQESIITNSPQKMVWGDDWDEMSQVVNFVDSIHAKKIGFDFLESSHDYAYQFILRKDNRAFQHVMVKNPSKILEKTDFLPDCIIAENNEGDQFVYHGKTFHKKWSGTKCWIYLP